MDIAKFSQIPQMLTSRDASLQNPTVISYYDCLPMFLIPDLTLFYVLIESLPADHSLISDFQETSSYVIINNAFCYSCLSRVSTY